MVAVNPVSGELAYAAGCIVVIYNLRRNKQVRYYRVDKSVACLSFSPNGQFLAIGERGYLPAITIWDGTDGTLCAELQRHQYGVACLAFSQDGRFLLSAGLVHDHARLTAWELRARRKDVARRLEVVPVGCAVVEDKILDADYCQAGNFFVTVGEKHFKVHETGWLAYWFLDDNGSFLVTGLHVNDLPELQHRDAVVNAKTSATFTGVGCGFGTCELKTFAVTSDGTLCCFGASGIMERLVSLESNRGNAISVTESYVAVGGSSGVVRLFSPSTLEYRATLPFPPAFGAANDPPNRTPNILYPAEPFRFPAVIATRITGSHVIVFYSDRSIFIYGTTNLDAVSIERSFLYHSGGIRDLQVAGSVRGVNAKGKLVYNDGSSSGGVSADTIPTGTFVTCSDDNTVRLWHLELHRRPVKPSRFEPTDVPEHEFWKNPYSQEMLRVVYNDHERDFENEHCVVLGGTCSHEASHSVHSPPTELGRNKGFRTLAVRSDQREIASGDQDGNVVVAPVPLEKPVIRIGAHSSKVNCIAYSGRNADGSILMASGGKDRLIQLYDCQRGHAVRSTLESHSAAVATVSLSRDGRTIYSSGADNAISISKIDAKGEVVESNVLPITDGKLFDTVLLPDTDTVVACCTNKLEVLNTSTGQQQKAVLVGEQHHIALCPANYCVAMSGSQADKTIHVVDMATGDTLATCTGHGEAVTTLKFTPDCRRLLSASSDGCIFVWRLADDIQTEIKARLPRVMDIQQPIPAPSREAVAEDQMSALPPPAPPIFRPSKVKDASPHAPPIVAPDSVLAKETMHTSDTVEKEKTTPTRVPKRSPPKWKGNGVAVPGPMAGIPMEDWMRTRASAKPTIHVTNDNDDSAELKPSPKVPSNNGTLVIDRLQTPDWAKTASGTDTRNPMEGPILDADAVNFKEVAHGKWGNHVASLLSTKGNDTDVNDLGNEVGSQQDAQGDLKVDERLQVSNITLSSAKTPGKDKLIDLSVEVLDANPQMSSSLALEREQLEKRKKQMDTANAVAAMNTRLSQLGLLKPPQKTTPTAQSKQETKMTPSPSKRLKASQINNNTGLNEAATLPSPILTKSLSSNSFKSSIPAPKTLAREVKDQRSNAPDAMASIEKAASPVQTEPPADKPRPGAVESNAADTTTTSSNSVVSSNGLPPTEMTECSSDEDADKFTNDLVNQALNALNSQEPPMPPPMDEQVTASLSMHVYGYGPPASRHMGESVDTKNQLGAPPTVEVDASLSSFTIGFEATSQSSQGDVATMQRSLINKASVTSSLSAFIAGYGGEMKVDGAQVESLSDASLNESMSAFTLGYSAAVVSPARVPDPISQIPVDVSLSNFTSGYGAAKADTSVTQEAVRPPSVASADVATHATALEALGNLYQPLEDAAMALEKASTAKANQDPKFLEIRELIETLRSAITDLASPS
ncbi:hypothetical protein ON010_g5936 [Phytophthora cinnamomi]|nr:hypothetical protein ON010_g5936 [Phytophthora cinnamomi]